MKMALLCPLLAVVCAAACTRRSDPAIDALNKQIVRLTRENVDLSERLKAAESTQTASAKEMNDLRGRIAVLEARLAQASPQQTTVLPDSSTINPPASTPSLAERRSGGVTDWSKSTGAKSARPPLPTSLAAEPQRGPVVITIGQQSSTDSTGADLCSSKWKTNYEMVEYCRKQQREAKESLARRAQDRSVGPTILANIQRDCLARWKDDYVMRDYCEKQQVAAYQRLNPR